MHFVALSISVNGEVVNRGLAGRSLQDGGIEHITLHAGHRELGYYANTVGSFM